MRLMLPLGALAILALAGCAAQLPMDGPAHARAPAPALPSRVLASARPSVTPPVSFRLPPGMTSRRLLVGWGGPDGDASSAIVTLASNPASRPAPRPVPTPVRRVVRSRTVQTAVAAPSTGPRAATEDGSVRRLFAARPARAPSAPSGGCAGGT